MNTTAIINQFCLREAGAIAQINLQLEGRSKIRARNFVKQHDDYLIFSTMSANFIVISAYINSKGRAKIDKIFTADRERLLAIVTDDNSDSVSMPPLSAVKLTNPRIPAALLREY